MSRDKLRAALVAKKGWTKQQLSRRARSVQRLSPMTTATAQAVVAHHEGVTISKYLEGEELREVRDAIAKLPYGATRQGKEASADTALRSASAVPPKARSMRSSRVVRSSSTFVVSDPILGPEVIRQAHDMAAPYVILHVLENSMREIVQRIMRKNVGADWWSSVMSRGKLVDVASKAASRQRTEETARWHQQRGTHPIDYIDLGELGKIMLARQEDFFPVLGVDREWFQSFMKELEPSRNVVCHMNRLKEHNLRGLEVRAAQWREMLEVQRARIPDR